MVDRVNSSNSTSKYNRTSNKTNYVGNKKNAYTIWKLQQLEKAQAEKGETTDSTKFKNEITGREILKKIEQDNVKRDTSIFNQGR